MSWPGGDRWLRSSYPSTESPEREEKLDRLMERSVEIDEARRAADSQQAAEQQDRWIQALTDARRPTIIPTVTALPPRLTLQKFVECVKDMGAYFDTFELTACAGEWPREQWYVYLRSSLSGQGLSVVASLPAADQSDYSIVKKTLLSTYQISTDTYRKKVFNQHFDTNNKDTWLYIYQQSFTQWIDSTGKSTFFAVLYELALRRLPRLLELEIWNIQPATFNDLKEAVTRYLGNQRREGDGRKTEQKERFRPTPQHNHNKSNPAVQKQFYSEKGNNWKKEEKSKLNVFGVAGRAT